MSFVSVQFVLFLGFVFGVYWIVPDRLRWLILLIASCFFYMQWNAKYIILIFLSITITFICAKFIVKTDSARKRKMLLMIASVSCLFVLFVFKYFNFFIDSFKLMGEYLGLSIPQLYLKVALPIGISFYTFQTLSYVVDVYRGEITAENHFGKYATYVLFFPQLVAGPIERSRNLLRQINSKKQFDYNQAVLGLRQLLWGYFKKVVIADTLAHYVDLIYGNLVTYKGFCLVIVAVMFSIQIYCDFSGYSDIAIGVSKLFGLNLMENFCSPYFSATIKEFWSRWHISLSNWLRDYVYIPLGGNRKGKIKKDINLLITFLLSGLWHGAGLNYIAWGGVYGVSDIVEQHVIPQPRRKNFGSIFRTFVFVTFAWIFFRAETINDALYVVRHLFDGITQPIIYIKNGIANLHGTVKDLIILITSIIGLFIFDYFSLTKNVYSYISNFPLVARWLIYYVLVGFIIYCLYIQAGTVQFIYFQF